MQRNKDLPASAVHPIQDKFGQVILMTGFTKQEAVALELLKSFILEGAIDKEEKTEIKVYIQMAYDYADEFCSYLEKNEGEKESGIIQNV